MSSILFFPFSYEIQHIVFKINSRGEKSTENVDLEELDFPKKIIRKFRIV